MLLKITLLLTCIICAAEAMPSYPGCNLVGSQSGQNVMTRTTIMGATPTDATNLISFSASQYSQGDEKINVTLANLQAGGAVIHTSHGPTLQKNKITKILIDWSNVNNYDPTEYLSTNHLPIFSTR